MLGGSTPSGCLAHSTTVIITHSPPQVIKKYRAAFGNFKLRL